MCLVKAILPVTFEDNNSSVCCTNERISCCRWLPVTPCALWVWSTAADRLWIYYQHEGVCDNPHIFINGTNLLSTGNFTYQSSIISNNNTIFKEVKLHISDIRPVALFTNILKQPSRSFHTQKISKSFPMEFVLVINQFWNIENISHTFVDECRENTSLWLLHRF